MELKDIQNKVDDIIDKFGGYWKPMEMFAALVEEVGELGREFNSVYGPKKKKKDTEGLKGEFGDVLYSLVCIANSLDINMEEVVMNSINKGLKRDKDRFK
jgi:NTP pyrophosphatase (non-canonical NTP hydrolase)